MNFEALQIAAVYFQGEKIPHAANSPDQRIEMLFDFAEKIAELSDAKIKLNAIETSQYPTPAKRPKNSVLDLDKISKTYAVPLKPWEESLEDCVQILQSN